MRTVCNGLDEFLEFVMFQLIQHDGQENRHRKTEDKLREAQGERVLDQGPELIGVEEALKLLESHPGTAGNAACCDVILEGDLHAIHGQIVKYEVIGDGQQAQYQELPVADPHPLKRFHTLILYCHS